jgi:hypothetical protein
MIHSSISNLEIKILLRNLKTCKYVLEIILVYLPKLNLSDNV